MPFLRSYGIVIVLGIAVVVTVINKYYAKWYGPCDECGKTDPLGLVKADILWSKKPLLCHDCQKVYEVVLLGREIPPGTSVAEEELHPETSKRRWVSKWIRGSFFRNEEK